MSAEKPQIDSPDDLPAMCLVSEVASFFRQTEDTIRKWRREGEFPHSIKAGKHILIPKQDVIDFAKRRYEH